MDQIALEVCINCSSIRAARQAVAAAYQGGAARVELCSAMELEGLTPRPQHMRAARAAFEQRPGLLVMVRPRAGDFSYSSRELRTMLRQIAAAAEAGADGVVFGVLRAEDQRVDAPALARLVSASAGYGLRTTFHRAFDAAPDPFEALERLVACGVQRVLSCGIPWGASGSALDGRARLARLLGRARGRIELVIGGGVNRSNVAAILRALPQDAGPVSVHAYSGAQERGATSAEAVAALLRAANSL